MAATPTIQSLSSLVSRYTTKVDGLPTKTEFASIASQVTKNTNDVSDYIGRVNRLFVTLPNQTDYAGLQRKVIDLSNNISNTITDIILSESQFNTIIVDKLSDISSYVQAAQTIIEEQGTIASKTNLTTAINTLSFSVDSKYFTISGADNLSSITRQLASSIFDLSISRVTIARFNELDTRLSSLTTTAASLSNPAAIFSEINNRALLSDLSSTNASLSLTNTSLINLSSYANIINTTLSGLQTNLSNNYSTTAQISSSIGDISSAINTLRTNIYRDLSSDISSTLQRINELSQNTIKITDFSGLSTFTNSISSLLYRNISDLDISSINLRIGDLSTNISTNSRNISSLSGEISTANKNIIDISTNFNKYYTSSQIDDISFAINTEIDTINSKYTTLQGKLVIPGISLNAMNSALSISGQYSAQNTLTINIPNDIVQWLYIEMKGGDGDFCGNRDVSFNHGEIITGYIPIMPYDIIKFHPGQKGVVATPITPNSNSIYHGNGQKINGGADGIWLASGAASVLEINGVPVLVARGGTGSDGKQIGGGAAVGVYRTPTKNGNITSKYFNQIIDLSQSYNTSKAISPSDGYIKYAFYNSLNKPQFSFRYRSEDSSGIDSTYVDEHANFIVGSDIAPRRLMVNGLLDISGAIKNSIINAMPTAITMNAPTTLNGSLTINAADKSGNIYINSDGELVASAKDIRLLSSDISINNYTFSTIKNQLTTIEGTYARRSELNTAEININGVRGAFNINPNFKTVEIFTENGSSQGSLISNKLRTVDASLQYIDINGGILSLNNSQLKLNTSSVNYNDNITLQQINIPTFGVPNPVPKVAAVFKSTGNTDICGQLTVAGTTVFIEDVSSNKQFRTNTFAATSINTGSLVTPTITTNIGAGDKTDISSGGISTKNLRVTGRSDFTEDVSMNKRLQTNSLITTSINTGSLVTSTITTNLGAGDKTDISSGGISTKNLRVTGTAQFGNNVNISGQLFTDLEATFKNGVNIEDNCNVAGVITATSNTSNLSSYIEMKLEENGGKTPTITMKSHDGSLFRWYAWDSDNNGEYPAKSLELWGYPQGSSGNKLMSINSLDKTILLNTPTSINGNIAIGKNIDSNSLYKLDVSGLSQISNGLIIRHAGAGQATNVSAIHRTVQPFEIRGSSDLLANDAGALHLTAGGGTNTNNQSYVKIVGFNDNLQYKNSIRLGTAGKDRVRIDSTGDVIINNNETTSSKISRLILGPSPGINNYDYCSMIESENPNLSNAASALKFYTHSTAINNSLPNERMRIDDQGHVGINRTDPQYTLDINGDTRLGVNGDSLTGIGTVPANGATLRVGGGTIIESGNLAVESGNLTVNSGILNTSGNISSLSGELYQHGYDFHLGYNNNTRGNSGLSRALVKGPGNKLIINFDYDFSGGTIITGTNTATNAIKLEGDIQMTGTNAIIIPSNPTEVSAFKIELTGSNLCINRSETSRTNIVNTAGPLTIGIRGDVAKPDISGIIIDSNNIYMNTDVNVERNLIIGTANAAQGASTNSIFFKGTQNDSGNTEVHTVISERIYESTERSELLLFKGNDHAGSGPDRIRLLSTGGTIIQTTNNAFTTYNTTSQVGPDASYNTAIHINNDGNVAIGKKVDSSTYKLDVSGNTTITGNLNVTGTATIGTIGGIVPIGGIIMWSGTLVPTNWALCDGDNSTPDLRGRFILGATRNSSGTNYNSNKGTTGIGNDARGIQLLLHNVGATGGERDHVLTINEMPSHDHEYFYREPAVRGDDMYSGDYWVPQDRTGTTDKTGGDQPHNNMPPFYALAYIQRIS